MTPNAANPAERTLEFAAAGGVDKLNVADATGVLEFPRVKLNVCSGDEALKMVREMAAV